MRKEHRRQLLSTNLPCMSEKSLMKDIALLSKTLFLKNIFKKGRHEIYILMLVELEARNG